MPVRRKRLLLAGIEGQLAAMKGDEAGQPRWQRIHRAVDALRNLPHDEFEAARLTALQRQLTIILKSPEMRCAWWREQRLTLARADCIIWQMHLRRPAVAVAASPGMQWPPRLWAAPDSDPASVAGVAAVAI